jgi:hypothetical protein
MYANLFDGTPRNNKVEETDRYMDLFGTSSEASVTSPADTKYDLFGGAKPAAQSAQSTDIFAGVQSINRAARASAEPKPEPVVVNFVDATSMFDCNYMDRQTIERDFKVLATENEACTHVLIDISQDMQTEYARIEKTHQTLIELVESIKQSLIPKKTWLGKEIPVDVAEVNRLIDSAQAFVKEPFKIDFFLTSRIQEAFDKSQRCDAKIAKLEKSMEHAIKHGGAQNDDPLYKRIVTARKMIELQNMSTQKSLTLLGGAYDKIEDFRQNSLVIVLIDAQSKLIK